MQNQKNILIINFGSLGDIHPFIGMGLALQQIGMNVTFGCNPAHVERVQAAGLKAFPVGPDIRPDDPEVLKVVLSPLRGPELLHKRYVFPQSKQSIEECLPYAKQSDLILTGIMGYFVPALAELAGKPWGMALLSPMLYWSVYDPAEIPAVPFLRPLRHLGPQFIKYVYKFLFFVSRNWAEDLQKARLSFGLKRQPNPLLASTMTSGHLNLALFSKHFAPPQADWPKNLIQTGYLSFDGSDHEARLSLELEKYLSQGEAPILLTLGSTNVYMPGKIYETFVEAFHQLPWPSRALLLVGRPQLEAYRKKFSSDKIAVFDYAPYFSLMPRCCMVIHQGGAGTTGQCLRAGIPSIILGSANDQLDNARHVEKIGAGVKLPLRQMTVESLKQAMAQAHQKAIREKAQVIGKFIRQENAEEVFTKAITKFFKA